MRFWYHWKALNFHFPMIPKSHDLDRWMAKYFVSKMKYIEILKKRRKDTEKCTIQYLFSMSVSFPYHFSIFSVFEFFIGQSRLIQPAANDFFHPLVECLEKKEQT